MKVTDFTKRALAFRRQEKTLLAQGYRRHETDWEIIRGGRQGEVITSAVVSTDGRFVYTKLEKAPPRERPVTTRQRSFLASIPEAMGLAR